MSRALGDVRACREALARLPELELSELRQQWRALYKSEASPHLSRELLLRAVAYRMQEIAFGGLRPEHQRQLRQFAQQFKETGEIRRRASLELKSGTRLVREWQGRTYEVLVLDDGFSWHTLLFAFGCREKDHWHTMVGTAVLWVEAEPACRPTVVSTTVPSRGDGERGCRAVRPPAAGAARLHPQILRGGARTGIQLACGAA